MTTAKKITIAIMLIAFASAVFIIFNLNKSIDESAWYVEITNSHINVREKADLHSNLVGKVAKGEKYLVIEAKQTAAYIWYKIDFNGEEGWIANDTDKGWLIDYNDPNDFVAPTLKYKDAIYYTNSIDTITYDHLIITDDKNDYVITHKVYSDKTDPTLFWVQYTVTDGSGKSDSRTQRVVFEVAPEEGTLTPIQDR